MQHPEQPSLNIQHAISVSVQSREQTNTIEPTQLAAFFREHDTSVWFYFGEREELASRNLLDTSNEMRLYAYIKDQFTFRLKGLLPHLQDTSIHWKMFMVQLSSPQKSNRTLYMLRICGLQPDQYKLITEHFPNAEKNSHSPVTNPDTLATVQTEQDEAHEFANQLCSPAVHLSDDDEILLTGAPLGSSQKIEDALLARSLFQGRAVTSLKSTFNYTVTTESNEQADEVHRQLQRLEKMSAEPGSSKP